MDPKNPCGIGTGMPDSPLGWPSHRVLILGGTGCVGEALTRRLEARGHAVAVFHRHAGEACRAQARHIHGNRHDLEANTPAFAAFAPDVVVDLIAGSAAAARRTLRALSAPGRRLIFAGSQEVYRAWSVFEGAERCGLEPVPVTESSRLRCTPAPPPASLDAAAARDGHWTAEGYDKLAMERAVRAWPGAAATILRLAPIYGPGDPHHRLAPLVRRMQDGRGFILLPRGWAEWRSARAYVENAAHGIVLAVEQPRAGGRTYNLSDGLCLSGLDWVRAVGQAFGWRGRVLVLAPRSAPPHLRANVNPAQHCDDSTQRIRAELGYRQPVALAEALAATLAWEARYPLDAGERRRIERDYASEDAVLLGLGVAAGGSAAGYKAAKAANSSATMANTQTLPSGPTVPPVIQCEP
jgi:nucleoside-diphosphate-sugar epimerase